MKNANLFLTLVVLVGMLSSCGWKENPLDGAGDILKQARPPGQNSDKPTGSDNSKTFVFDAPNAVNFVEGTKEELKIGVRTTIPGIKKIDLTIVNMSEFPGAYYDAPSQTFSWNPPFGTVSSGVSLEAELKLRATGLNTSTNVVNVQEQVVVIQVLKNGQDPIVKSVNFPAFGTTLRENSNYKFSVTVQDVDKLADESRAPSVLILPPQSAILSLAGFVQFVDRTHDVANFTYTYNYQLNLLGVELTDSSKNAGFEIQAISSFGKKSATTTFSQILFTKLATPTTTWLDTKMFKNNETNTVPFIIYDAKGESKISLDRNDNVPVGGSVDCKQRIGVGSIECVFTYKPSLAPASLPSYGMINVNLSSANRDVNDTEVSKTVLKLNYQVIAGSQP